MAHNSQRNIYSYKLKTNSSTINTINNKNQNPLAYALSKRNVPYIQLLCEPPVIKVSSTVSTPCAEFTKEHAFAAAYYIAQAKNLQLI